jgi:hypothetical protein
MEGFSASRAHFVLLSALIGGALGATLMLFNPTGPNLILQLHITTGVVSWFSLNVLGCCLYAVLAVPLWKTVRSYWQYRSWQLLLSTVILIVLTTVPGFLASNMLPGVAPTWLDNYKVRLDILLTAAFGGVALPAALVIWLIQLATRREFGNSHIGDTNIEKFSRFHDDLAMMIFLLGVGIGILVLSTAALRQANIDMLKLTADDFPDVWVSIYGAYATLVLSFIFVPAQWSLNAVGLKLCDLALPLPGIKSSDWSNVYSKRKSLQELLRISYNDPRNWQTSLALLAPILATLVARLLPGK